MNFFFFKKTIKNVHYIESHIGIKIVYDYLLEASIPNGSVERSHDSTLRYSEPLVVGAIWPRVMRVYK